MKMIEDEKNANQHPNENNEQEAGGVGWGGDDKRCQRLPGYLVSKLFNSRLEWNNRPPTVGYSLSRLASARP